MNYFPNTLTVGFKKGTFACTFQSLNASSFSKLGIYIYMYIYIQNSILTPRIDSS